MKLDNINFDNIDWSQYQNEIKEIKDYFEEIKKDKKLMEKLKNEEYPKLREFTKKELQEQLEKGAIDLDFIFGYIVIRDKVYNKLIDRVNYLEKENQKYKEVFDKAIEHINKMFNTGFYNDDYYLGRLKQILEDKEVE